MSMIIGRSHYDFVGRSHFHFLGGLIALSFLVLLLKNQSEWKDELILVITHLR